jgi:hypothetical protein
MTPLGYDAKDRKLVINSEEADTVRHIFQRYAALKSVRALKEDLDVSGIVSKIRICANGTRRGGLPMARGALYLMLQNWVYRGQIVHKGTVHPGLHETIIEEHLWNEVQEALAKNRIERATQSTAITPSLLAGLAYDSNGERMVPTHANKKGVRYRYYISQSLIKRGRPKTIDTGARVPAADLEALVEKRIQSLLRDQTALADAAEASTVAARKALIEHAADLEQRWPTLPFAKKRVVIHALVARIDVMPDSVEVAIRSSMLLQITAPDRDLSRPLEPSTSPVTVLSIAARLRRAGMETRLMIEGAVGNRVPDRSLVRLLGQAQNFHNMVAQNTDMALSELAEAAGVTRSYFTRVFRLSFLAPRITAAILEGSQPVELTANKLKQAGKLNLLWSDQLNQLGFP